LIRQARGYLADPNVVLALSAALVLLTEYARLKQAGIAQPIPPRDATVAWLTAEVAVAATGLVLAWRAQAPLRLVPLLATTLGFYAGWIAIHIGLSYQTNNEWSQVNVRQGTVLLDGGYPKSEYPTGAVLLFAFEAWAQIRAGLRGNHLVHAVTMVPFHLLAVAVIWRLRTTWSPWLAAVVALWPTNAFYVEQAFDAVPASLLALGTALPLEGLWAAGGVALGLGASVKWTPVLALLPLVAYLARRREWRGAALVGGSCAAAFAVMTVPFLAWRPDNVLEAYRIQAGREITGESVWYLPLRALGLDTAGAANRYGLAGAAGVPGWADVLATVVQLTAVLALAWLAWRASSLRRAAALAVLAPAVFLLLNRVVSPQYILLYAVAWAFAGSLLARSRQQQLLVGLALMGACSVRLFISPFPAPYPHLWEWLLLLHNVFALGVTGWLVALAARDEPTPGALPVPARARPAGWAVHPGSAPPRGPAGG
jgi:uncharacterized membrane protein